MRPLSLRYWRMITLIICAGAITPESGAQDKVWRKHTVYAGAHCNTCVAADFTGDGLTDVICHAGGATRLLVAPNWNELILHDAPSLGLIHSETMDVDRDGAPDFIGTQYSPGLIFWLRRPANPLQDRWTYHVIDNQVDGIHGLLVGDVDRDGRPDLLANSAQPTGPFANSLVWYRVPEAVTDAPNWPRHVIAPGNAPGLSHYLGLGDVNGDGRPDVATGAKGGPQDTTGQGDWFAWWEAPEDPTKTWTKHLLIERQPGATNIHPADVNGDGLTDFVASRGHGQGVIWLEAPTWRVHDLHPTLTGPHCLVVADLDGDGDVDVATCAKDDQQMVWFENDGQGRFTTHILDTNQAAYDIRAVDMDNDGDLDLLVAGQVSRNVVWYENPVK